MIKPSKYLDMDSCVLNISTKILETLVKKNTIEYKKLYNKVCNSQTEFFKNNYIYALNFLFLLGKIEYDKERDKVRLIQ